MAMHVVARLMLGLGLVVTLALGATTAKAQQYPSKPIRVIVSIAAASPASSCAPPRPNCKRGSASRW
jgi:hypothetical protein